MVVLEEVRALALTLPRTTEHLIRDRVKFRIGRIVYLAFSRDETLMGFAFPKEQRDGLVAAEPHKFLLPSAGDLRYNWVAVRLAALDPEEMTDRVIDAWTACRTECLPAAIPPLLPPSNYFLLHPPPRPSGSPPP